MIRVAITGAAGRMGRTLIEAAAQQADMRVTVAIERPGSSVIGADAGEVAGVGPLGVTIADRLESVCDDFDVLIDFTRPAVTLVNLAICQAAGRRMVIGTTGFTPEQQSDIERAAALTELRRLGAVIVGAG